MISESAAAPRAARHQHQRSGCAKLSGAGIRLNPRAAEILVPPAGTARERAVSTPPGAGTESVARPVLLVEQNDDVERVGER